MHTKTTNSVALFLVLLLLGQTMLFSFDSSSPVTSLDSEFESSESPSVSGRNGSSAQVWSTPVSLDSTDEVGEDSSLAIDSNDNLHVTYLDYTNENQEYMTTGNNTGENNTVIINDEDVDEDVDEDADEDADEDGSLPSIGVAGTVMAISAGLFIAIRREDEQ